MDQKRVAKYPSVESISSEESTPAEETTTFNDDLEILEALYKPILDELILDAIWNVCFEVHRAAQHGIYKERKNLAGPGTDSSVSKPKYQTPYIFCPNCNAKTGATKYTSHLFSCLGGGGRSSFRNARNRITEVCDNDAKDEGTVEKSKKSRKKQGKKTKPSDREQSSSKPKLTFEDLKGMSYEKREEFFSKNCGSISKKTKTLCKHSHNCTNHNDEARRYIRFLLGISEDKTANDEQIDVDTVDEGNNANFDNWF